jgi:hypothetical protein
VAGRQGRLGGGARHRRRSGDEGGDVHRKEGDLDNARYWYRRAGAKPFTGSLEAEWAELVRALLTAA